MKKHLISLFTLAVAAIGCTREIEPEKGQNTYSEYLVIKAECSDITKSDINEGHSVWEEGDVIEVAYRGSVYQYTASTLTSDGTGAYFTSTEGIADYDGSEIVAYYKAINAAEGIVGIEASREITFDSAEQINPSRAPLLGKTSQSAKDGVLNMRFDNIFSVMELRIDPTGKESTSPVKTLTIEPADDAVFNGFLTFAGSIDPATLALSAAENGTGNSLVLKLPAGMDITKPQTIKFPIGRFTSSTGLKVTLTLENGETHQKNIYKSGVQTFAENNGIFSAKHLARAMYSFIPTFFSGGDGTEANPYAIGSVEDLRELATYVASKEDAFLPFRTAHYIQIDDIDYAGETHNSIGNTNDAAPYSFFCGKYNGNGYKISNAVIANPNSNKAHGFFGYLDGSAHIKNMKLDNVTINATTWNVGTIVGCAQSTSTALIENCVITNGKITGNNSGNGGICGKLMAGTISNCSYQGYITATTSGKHQIGGIAGEVSSAGSIIENCSFNGAVKGACGNVGGIAGSLHGGSSVKNCSVSAQSTIEGGSVADNGINVGGIVGYINNNAGGKIQNCTCAATITARKYDIGGIVGRSQGAAIIGCTFSGKVSTDFYDSSQSTAENGYSRIGGIAGHIHGTAYVENCTVTGTVTGKYANGGVVGWLEAGSATSCKVDRTTIKGDRYSGGVVGLVKKGGIASCTITSLSVTNTSDFTGGVAGYITNGAVKENKVTNPTLTGSGYVGGIAGGMEANASVTSCQVTGGTIKGSSLCIGGIAGYFNKGGLISYCTTQNVAVETSHKLAGGILGNMADGANALTTRIENCNVIGGTVKDTANGLTGGILGGCNGQGIINKCSSSADIIGANNHVGGIVGWVSTSNLLIANCIYYEGTISSTAANVGGIAGQLGASTMGNTTIVNCAAFPAKIESGSGANIAGISGVVNTTRVINCYSPITSAGLLAAGAEDAKSSGSIYGWLRGANTSDACSGVLKNVYWLTGLKAGNFSGNYKYEKAEQSVTDAQMKNTGTVSMPSTGTAYPCFLDALNAGADEYNTAMVFDIRAEEWVMGTNGYPVIFGCPIASSTATSSKTRVSFIGDSITTYKGYTLFPNNGQYPNGNYSDFTSVTQTYWYQLIYDKMSNAVLEANSSHTGTCVQNTTSNGHPGFGFLNRYADLGNPDVIFINGGTNDSWSFKLPVGTLDFNIATDNLDTYQFAQAYDKLIRLIKAKYPKAKIFCIIGDSVMDSQYTAYAQVIRDVCRQYDLKYAEVVFADRAASTYDNVHPNVAGMADMANQIWNQIKSYI